MQIIKTTEEFDNVLKDNSAVFVDFYADWCGPCKMLGPVIEELAPSFPDVKFVKVNVDELGDVAGRFGIMSIPTMITFKNGALVKQETGFAPKEQVETLVKTVL